MSKRLTLLLFTAALAIELAALPAHAAPTPTARLGWLPAAARSVIGSRPTGSPILSWVLGAMGLHTPSCWLDQIAAMEGVFQIWRATGDSVGVLAEGKLDRDAVEKCMLDVMGALNKGLPLLKLQPQLRRDGAITDVIHSPGKHLYVGWGRRWVVAHEDRAWVAELVAASARKGAPRSPVASLLARVGERPDREWAVSVEDLSGAIVGVPSRGFVSSYSLALPPGGFEVSLVYGSAKEAGQAVGAIERGAGSKELAPALRSLAGSLRPHQRAESVDFTIDLERLSDPALLEAVQAAVKKRRGD